jgi:hypothetical protein
MMAKRDGNHWVGFGVLAWVGLVAFACSSGGETDDRDPNGRGGGFESGNPNLGEGTDYGNNPGAGAGGTASSGELDSGSDDKATRAIQEADIIQMDGDRLYAMSRYGGLGVIDAARPAELRMLGRYRMEAQPFEMYVRGNVVLGMFTGWGQYVESAEGWRYEQTSRVVALDVSDPGAIDKLADFSIPGDISDSRIVGDVMYVVAYENGYCWGCDSRPRTRIVSLNVADPTRVSQVDELAFDDVNDHWGWGKRSITVTTKRMYVAGREWNGTDNKSTIQVVDISDPSGALVMGTSVEADGQISSRWQMDEHAGVLRVISQPWDWALETPPSVQTFRVDSSKSLAPLGRTELVLPRPEQLQSVRFDGTRAYAITFERTDPLFTIDLSDPAAPLQMGELEMPGWVYHMEPRGDRVYGLGYDQGNASGSIHVSIFDVSNLAAPTLVDRVNFGGDWGSLAEDQDRIQKAFKILETEGLILVPYSGWDWSSSSGHSCRGTYQSGVQLIDFTRDDLVLRGNAASLGQARRGFLHRTRLFTVSDDRVQSFDIDDRDAPRKLSDLALARRVNTTAVVGSNLVRLGQDWWTNTVQLDVVPVSRAGDPQGIGSLDIQSALANQCGYGLYNARVVGNGERAHVVYDDYDYTTGFRSTAVATVDLSDPRAPRLESNAPLGFSASYWGAWGMDGVASSGDAFVKIGETFVFLGTESSWDDRGEYVTRRAWLDVADLSDPAKPRWKRLALPNSSGVTGLHAAGTSVLTSHFEPAAEDPGRVRFYIDRIDVSDPSAPKITSKVNVPGSLLAWDEGNRRAVTVDYTRVVTENVDYTTCYQSWGYRARWIPDRPDSDTYYYYEGTGTCVGLRYTMRLVHVGATTASLDGSWELPRDLQISQAALGTDRLYVALNRSYYGYDCAGCSSEGMQTPLLVLSGLDTGALQVRQIDLGAGGPWGGGVRHLVAFDDRALVQLGWQGELAIVDAANAAAPRVAQTVETIGHIAAIQRHGDQAILSSGYDGVQIVQVR